MAASSSSAGRARRASLPAVLAVALVAAAGCGGGDSDAGGEEKRAGTAKPGTATVGIAGFKYKPETTTVRAGGTVRFENADKAPHTATADPGAPAAFVTGRLEKGTWEMVVPTRPGTYAYHCDFHPFMKGSLRVTR